MTIQETSQALNRFSDASEVRQRARNKEIESFRELKRVRMQTLVEEMDKRGLALCSDGFSHGLEEETREERLGLFPKDKMKLLYFSDAGGYPNLSLLCPKHTPKPEHINTARATEESNWPYKDNANLVFNSEVVERDGRFFTIINSIEVYPQNPDSVKNSHHDSIDEVYRHFGIPDLPKDPGYF